MITTSNPNALELRNSVVTIGFFDGVHLGHQSIIQKLVATAKQQNTKSVIITFWPHPRMVIGSDAHMLKLLSSLSEKFTIFEQLGVDAVLTIDFDPNVAQLPAAEFVQKVMILSLKVNTVIVGFNHSFGKNGEGNYLLLKQFEARGLLNAIQVDPITLNGAQISSTKIRQLLEQGDLELANTMLGRPYQLTGTIEGGQQIGRSIGFPTANILPNDFTKQIPAQGVYAVWVLYQKIAYPAMLNIGIRPTIGDGLSETIEAHIIGFNKNIYNEGVSVLFQEKIRNEMKFSSIEQLKEQLSRDKETTLRSLGFPL
jgi:riboflavin kinase / FMN adenylyltransferase